MVSLLFLGILSVYPLFLNGVSAAYLKWESCTNASPLNSSFNGPPTLSIGLVDQDRASYPALLVNFSFWTTPSDCVSAASAISRSEVLVDMLTTSSVYKQAVNGSCKAFSSDEGVSGSIFEVAIVLDNIDNIPFLSSIGLEIQLFDDIYPVPRTCQVTKATPALSPRFVIAIQAAAWIAFAIIVAVGLSRAIWDNNIRATDPQHRSRTRTALPEVGGFLQYLQLIFLAGSLNIQYPGFYQPIVGQLHWFLLITTGAFERGSPYQGVRDGIYETNSTYTDDSGLDIMMQTIGGSRQLMITWLNMVLFVIIIVLVGALNLQAYFFFTRHPKASKHEREQPGLMTIYVQVLWFILSCFSLPLATLMFYQLSTSASSPLVYAVLALTVASVSLTIIRWFCRRVTKSSSGTFIIDSAQRYRRISAFGGFEGHDRLSVQISVTLTCVRAAAIGGLQVSGIAQLAILITCELFMFGCILCLQSFSVISLLTLSTVAKLCTLAMMIPFLGYLGVSEHTKRNIGFATLVVQGLMLFVYLLNALYCMFRLLSRGQRLPGQVYGLHDLRWRRISLSLIETRPYAGNPLSPTTVGRFYRQPRSSSGCYHNGERNMTPESSKTSFDHDAVRKPSYSGGEYGGNEQQLPQRAHQRVGSCESYSKMPTASLGPFWKDYSFREADMFYHRTYLRDNNREIAEVAPNVSQCPTYPALLRLWKGSGRSKGKIEAKSKGFEVVRPPKDPESER